MTRLLLAVVLVLSLGPRAGHADDRVVVGADGKPVRLTTAFGKRAAATLRIGSGKPTRLHAGMHAGTVIAGHARIVVAFAIDAAREPFRVVVIEDGKAGEPVAIARAGTRRDVPFAVVGTATPNGFALFFQEVEAADPTAAHTYLVELDLRGTPGAAREVAVPWSLAAAAHDGTGYHLALIYPGGSDGMRLSMVSLTADGVPEQHPDWASAPGWIADVHLLAADGRVRAFYRGGKGGNRLLESDVTTIRAWGTEPPKATDHGALAPRQAIAIANGKPTKIDLR